MYRWGPWCFVLLPGLRPALVRFLVPARPLVLRLHDQAVVDLNDYARQIAAGRPSRPKRALAHADGVLLVTDVAAVLIRERPRFDVGGRGAVKAGERALQVPVVGDDGAVGRTDGNRPLHQLVVAGDRKSVV